MDDLDDLDDVRITYMDDVRMTCMDDLDDVRMTYMDDLVGAWMTWMPWCPCPHQVQSPSLQTYRSRNTFAIVK